MMAEPAAPQQAPLSSSMHTAAAGYAPLPRLASRSRLRATAAPRVRAAGTRGGLLGMGRVAEPWTGACCCGGPTGVCGVRGDAPCSPCADEATPSARDEAAAISTRPTCTFDSRVPSIWTCDGRLTPPASSELSEGTVVKRKIAT